MVAIFILSKSLPLTSAILNDDYFCPPVMSEYNEPEADEIPLSEDGTAITGETLEGKMRKDSYRRHLERQRSREFDRYIGTTI